MANFTCRFILFLNIQREKILIYIISKVQNPTSVSDWLRKLSKIIYNKKIKPIIKRFTNLYLCLLLNRVAFILSISSAVIS